MNLKIKMKVTGKITSLKFLKIVLFVWYLNNIIVTVNSDKTSCRSSIETGDGLHYVCFCYDDSESDEVIELDDKDHLTVDLEPDAGGKNDFSLAKFAYNLSGAYFRKKVHFTFQYCRHLTIILDQNELHTLGSNYFRPDIQVSSCFVEHVYHLELLRDNSDEIRQGKHIKVSGISKFDIAEGRYPYFKDTKLDLTVYSVALVKVHAGANFTSLVTSTPESILYIDLTDDMKKDDVHLDAKGFHKENVYFITRRQQKIPLEQVLLLCYISTKSLCNLSIFKLQIIRKY